MEYLNKFKNGKKVTKQDFYKVMSNLDVTLYSKEYETIWKTRSGNPIGITEGYKSEEKFYILLNEVQS